MMRLIGVPARIATGYLTDLTYAKDGHILLHLGDRHAWPEIFVEGEGWVVLDVTPANAENEQVIVPDEKLLEDLMSQIDPAQALVTPPPPAPQDPVEKSALEQLMTKKRTLQSLFIILLGYLLLKLYIREGWRLAKVPAKRARLAYASFAAQAVDLGLPRNLGETRQEYKERLSSNVGINAQDLTQALERVYYAAGHAPNNNEVDVAIRTARQSIRKARLGIRKFISFLNPTSITRWGRL